MGRKTMVVLVLLAASALAVYFLWPSDEARIRKLIAETAGAAERGDIEGVMSAVGFNYRDSYGLSYLYLKKLLRQEFGRLSDIVVEYEVLGVEVKEGTAEARVKMRVIATMGSMRGYYLGDLDTPLSLFLGLEKGPTGKWVVSHAEYSLGDRAPF